MPERRTAGETHLKHVGPLANFAETKKSLLLSILSLIVLTFSVSVAASALATLWATNSENLLLASLGSAVAASAALVWFLWPARTYSRKIKGVLTLDERNLPVSILRYGFSFDAYKSIHGLLTESRAIGKKWSEGDFRPTSVRSAEDSLGAGKLARDLIEYCCLDILSSHLIDYFPKKGLSKRVRVETLNRQTLPPILNSNKFLEYLSKPIEERDGFEEARYKENGEKELGKTYMVWTPGGALFQRFELQLPSTAKLSRTDDGTLRIQSWHYSISLKADFSGYNTTLPLAFEELYLGLERGQVRAFAVEVLIQVYFGPLALFSSKGYEAYDWIDGYIAKLQERFDFELFLNKIGWEQVITQDLVGRIAHGRSVRDQRPAELPAEDAK